MALYREDVLFASIKVVPQVNACPCLSRSAFFYLLSIKDGRTMNIATMDKNFLHHKYKRGPNRGINRYFKYLTVEEKK